MTNQYMTFSTGVGLVTFHSLFEMDAFNEAALPAYKLELAIDPSDPDLTKLRAEVLKVAREKWGEAGEIGLKNGSIRSPFKKGDDMATQREANGAKGDAFKGKTVIRPSTAFDKNRVKNGPAGVRVKLHDLSDVDYANQHLIYSGCYGQAAVTVSAYDTGAQKGVKLYLAAFQKHRDGDKLMPSADLSHIFKRVDTGDATAEVVEDPMTDW